MTVSPVSVIFRFGCGLGPGGGEQVEERPDLVSFLGGVAEQAVPVHGVSDAPPGAGTGEVPGGLQVGHDGLHGAVGQADDGADVPDAGLGVTGDLLQDVPVAVSSVQVLPPWSGSLMLLECTSRERTLAR